MSEVFCFTIGGAETIEAFNNRLASYCNENPIVGVVPSVLGGTLMLSLTELEDIPFPLPMAVQPLVLILHPQMLQNLEQVVTDTHKHIRDSYATANKLDKDDAELSIVQTTLHPCSNVEHPSLKHTGFAVIVINSYEITND